MQKISAVIITLNEQDQIEHCIQSVKSVADEIVVLDSFSTDRTEEICRNLGVRFYQNAFTGYRDQKNLALKYAQYDYILSLDADEALSDELKDSILAVKKNWKFDAYNINRYNNYCGQWINHSNWYPDKKIRLFDRRKGDWGGLNIHETIKMQKGCSVGFIKGDILHRSFSSIEEHIDKINKFSTLSAQEYFKCGKKSSIFKIIFHSKWRFFKAYFLRRGFLDGFNGFVISSFSAYESYLKYVKLRRLILDDKKKGKRQNQQKQVNIAK